MTVPVFMRRDQVPEGHEWQTFDDDDWCAYDSTIGSGFEARWVRVRPVAATPPDTGLWKPQRRTGQQNGIVGPNGERLWCYDVDQEASTAIRDDVLAALNGGVLRSAAPTGPPADTCQTCHGDKGWVSTTPMVPGSNLPGWIHCPDCVGSPVPAYKDEPGWVTVAGCDADAHWSHDGRQHGVTIVAEALQLDPDRWDYADPGGYWYPVSKLRDDEFAQGMPVVVRSLEEDR